MWILARIRNRNTMIKAVLTVVPTQEILSYTGNYGKKQVSLYDFSTSTFLKQAACSRKAKKVLSDEVNTDVHQLETEGTYYISK